jgi:large subunit ribosomal protein L9
MEVLLLQDVPGIGKKNDLLVVGDGFALNYLLPKRAALVATPLVRKRYAEFIRRRAEEREQEKAVAADAVKSLTGKTIVFTKKVTKTNKLYAAITEKNIVDALKDQHGLEVSVDAIRIDDPIKATGTFQVLMQLREQLVPLTVQVQPEK